MQEKVDTRAAVKHLAKLNSASKNVEGRLLEPGGTTMMTLGPSLTVDDVKYALRRARCPLAAAVSTWYEQG